jgi:hypothetical protein
MIHIGRAGSKLGTFSEFEVRRGLATGRFSLSDLGWTEGMENWTPLANFPDLIAEPEPPLPMEALLDAPAPNADAANPAAPIQPPSLPWERRERGLVASFAETARMVLTSPAAAFARMRTDGGLFVPLFYNLIGAWLGVIASGVYRLLYVRAAAPPAAAAATAATTTASMSAYLTMTPAGALSELKFVAIMGPILVSILAIVAAGVIHLFLMLAGGATKRYHVTLRVFCYCYGSTQLLQLLPICGGPLALVWFIVCSVAGLAAAHATTTGRSLAAVALFAGASISFVGLIFLMAAQSGPGH